MLFPALALAQDESPRSAKGPPSVTLTGNGTVKAKPDEGYITVGVTTYSQKSADAVALHLQGL